MQVKPYLSFNGDCEAAFTFYQRCLGAKIGGLFRYGGSPMAGQAPPDWSEKIMHGSLTIGGMELMAADVAFPDYYALTGFSLSVHTTDPAEAERIFRDLADGGQVSMPLEKTFWAERFGMVADRFGVRWMINCGPDEAA